MKINESKIVKYLAGGMIYQPLPMIPPSTDQGTGSAPEETEQEGIGTIDEKMIQKLLGNGITNDVMAFSKDIEQAYSQYEQLSALERESILGKQLRNTMKGDWSRINNILRNKAYLDDSKDKIKADGAMSDIAITNNGMMVKDTETNRIAELTYEEYLQNYNNPRYKILTNTELINEREYNPLLTNNQEIFKSLQQARSTQDVKKEVLEILSNLGESSDSVSKQGYLLYGSGNEEIEKAARELIGMGTKGFYKVTQLQESTTNAEHIMAARQVMWDNLSPNAKSLLKAKVVKEGGNTANLEEAAKEYAISLLNLNLKTDTKTSSQVDYDSKMTDDTLGSGGDESLTDDINFLEMINAGVGDHQKVVVNTGGSNAIEVNGFSVGPMMVNDKPTGMTSMRTIMPSLNSVIDRYNVSIGGNLINPQKLDAILYEGGEVTVMKFPSTKDFRTGKTVPDFDRADKFFELQEKLESLPNVTAREEMIMNSGFLPDGRGNIAADEYDEFVVFDGMINNNVLPQNANKSMLEKVDGDLRDMYKSLHVRGSADGSGDKNILADADYPWYDWIYSNDVYAGRVFMLKKQGSYIGARSASGKGLNTPKSVNTPLNLGSGPSQSRANRNNNNNILYSLE